MPQIKHFLVYRTENVLTGHYYYGVHSTFDINDGYLGSGKRLKYAINKYGKENFRRRIIRRCRSAEEMYRYEKKIVARHLGRRLCYNLAEGGRGGWHHVNNVDCPAEKIRLSKLRQAAQRAGYKKLLEKIEQDPEIVARRARSTSQTLKKAYEAGHWIMPSFEGCTHSDEAKAKIGAANSVLNAGSNNPHYGKTWISHDEARLTMRVLRTEVQEYFDAGWRPGRVMRYEHVRAYLLELP